MSRGLRSAILGWLLVSLAASSAWAEGLDEVEPTLRAQGAPEEPPSEEATLLRRVAFGEALKAYRAFLLSVRERVYVEVDAQRSEVLIRDAQEGVDDVVRLLDRYLADPASLTDPRDKEKMARLAGSAELTFSHVHRGRASALAGTAFRVFVANVSDRYVGVWFGTPFGLKEAYLDTLKDYYPRKDALLRGEDGRDLGAAQLRATLAGLERRLDAEARSARAAATGGEGPTKGLVERLDEVQPGETR